MLLHVRTPPLYLRNYWADLFQIWHAVKYHTSACDAPLKSGVLLHVRTCTPLLCISEITGPIELKFGMRPSIIHARMMHLANRRCYCTCARGTPFLHLPNYWADKAQIWHAPRYDIFVKDATLKSGMVLHVRTCSPICCISETTGPIEFKFGIRH